MTSFRHTDLVLALSKQKDIDRLRELCRGRKIPAENRADVWKVLIKSSMVRIAELFRCKYIEKLSVYVLRFVLMWSANPMRCQVGMDYLISMNKKLFGTTVENKLVSFNTNTAILLYCVRDQSSGLR